MSISINDPDLTIHHGDARVVLPSLPKASVDCVVSSPPFYRLRDYGTDGQIGLEETIDGWVTNLVEVFRGAWGVLRDHGTLWVELGDGFQDKQLLGAPWLFAFAMKQSGWLLRQAIIWNKSNAMPESATDRCTMAHSYIFLFSKRPTYYFDHVAIQEPAKWDRWGQQTTPKYGGTETSSGWIKQKTKEELSGRTQRNARSVWTIPTGSSDVPHFAVFPEALVERMLKAGCPTEVCVTCHKPRERILGDSEGQAFDGEAPSRDRPDGVERRNPRGGQKEWDSYVPARTTGWSDCGCGNGFTPGICLDPFMGSGTTAVVARRLGLRTVGVEINMSYIDIIRRRTQQLSLLEGGTS